MSGGQSLKVSEHHGNKSKERSIREYIRWATEKDRDKWGECALFVEIFDCL